MPRTSLPSPWRQRYLAWLEPLLLRLPPDASAEAQKLDTALSGHSNALWGTALGMGGLLLGSVFGLIGAGFPWGLALLVSLTLCWGVLVAGLSAWLQPDRVLGGWGARVVTRLTLAAFGGAVAGFVVGRVVSNGWPAWSAWPGLLWDAARRSLPVLLVAMLGTLLLMLAVAWARRQVMQRELQALRLVSERDAAARQAAEAQLKLLQGQIQPHFIFNTLSAVQHWVDTGDARAAPLLRSLTAFLRGSTELLGRDSVSLSDEAAMVGHYLSIMQARLGQRLRFEIDLAPALSACALPPGLLLTLVENAVEHGIAPSLLGGWVRVTAVGDVKRWTLRVVDDGAGLIEPLHEGVGLANCRQRLAHYFGPRARLQLRAADPGTEASVHIHGEKEGAA